MSIKRSIKISTLAKNLQPRTVSTTQGYSLASPAAINALEGEFTSLCCDSRQVVPGSAFFALRGTSADGHRFVEDALKRGARVIVSEEEIPMPEQVVGLVVSDARKALAQAAVTYYDDPTADMLVIGITGTNGKTTVSYLLEALLKAAGYRPAVIGTVNYRFEDQQVPSTHTTPESADLLALAAQFRMSGADALILEVSSHSLDQRRVDGIDFDLAVFTNLTPEHLDYHGDMETYFQAKTRLFAGLGERGPKQAVVDIDGPYGQRLADRCTEVWSCGLNEEATVHPVEHRLSMAGIEARIAGLACEFDLRSMMRGEFNLSNLLCAATAGLALGFGPELVASALSTAPPVPGRLEPVTNDRGSLVLVDYAHTSDALEKALVAVRELRPRRVITLFGCGGDRDRTKRAAMGAVAASLSELVVVTSDNPRSEDPDSIIDEVRSGLNQVFGLEWSLKEASERGRGGYVAISDRREAIEFAVSLLEEGDVLLAAGKGHEDYQVVGSQRIYFDDREEIRRALRLV